MSLRKVKTVTGINREAFDRDLRPAGEPVLLKQLVGDWPLVNAARAGDGVLFDRLSARATSIPISVAIGRPEIRGRFHYEDDGKSLNFERIDSTLPRLLGMLAEEAQCDQPRAVAGQGLAVHRCLKGFAKDHHLPLLPASVLPRMWVGNAACVATHNDELENLACVAAGRRRFTLFPPEAVGDLYMGPFELTPGGTPISMVHVTEPDLGRYPRFAHALQQAQVAEMEPGDVLYIPYQWFHHVEALDPVNILVNYWWDPARQDLGSPWDALLHGIIALRALPPDQRRAWKAAFDHYVFLENGDPGAHLPADMRGILGTDSPGFLEQLKRDLRANLDPVSRVRSGPLG